MDSGQEITQQRSRTNSTIFLLGFLGLAATLIIEVIAFHRAVDSHEMASLFFLMGGVAAGGFLLRVIRRKEYFGRLHTWHQAFSYEALFQGIILLNPGLPYPFIEQAFICRNAGLAPHKVQHWFQVRTVAAIVIPMALLGTLLFMMDKPLAGTFVMALCLTTIAYQSGQQSNPWRFAVALLLGITAALVEGLLFVQAAGFLSGSVPYATQIFLLYAASLVAFELSPIPLGLGILELSFLFCALLVDLPHSALLLPLTYRLFRMLPVIALTLFYLPRYKLSISDLYNPTLTLALQRTWVSSPMIREKDQPLLSIVIPAYNEEERLPRFLPLVIQYAKQLEAPVEIIVVNDGSTDSTQNYVRHIADREPFVRLLGQSRNLGKGAAVRHGVMEARGLYIVFADADGSTPINEASKLMRAAELGGDVIIASRKIQGASSTRTQIRDLMGIVFYRLTNLLAVPGISDTQCGFKLFRYDAAKRLFPMLKEEGWAFDVELLYLAQKLGMTIMEVPVEWTAMPGSKISPLRDAIKMVRAVFRIRQRWKGGC